MTPASPRTQLIGGIAAAAVGLGVGALIYARPADLAVPAWVAYFAVAGFVLAGFCLVVGSLALAWLRRLLGIAVALCLLMVALWIAFGPGERECAVSIPLLDALPVEAVCREAFALGALLVAFLLGFVLHGAANREA